MMRHEERELGNPFALFFLQAAIDQQRANEERAQAERHNQEQIAELKRQDRKGDLTREKDEGEDLERNYAARLRGLERALENLKEERQYGVTEDWLTAMDATKKALSELKAAREKWTARKQALYDELKSLGGDMATQIISHTIKPGEDLAILAKRYYNDAARWPDIWAQNPQIKVQKNSAGVPIAYVKPGDVVRVPVTTVSPAPTTTTPTRPPSSVPDEGKVLLPEKDSLKPESSSKRQGGGGAIVLWGSLGLLGLGLAAVIAKNEKQQKKKGRRR